VRTVVLGPPPAELAELIEHRRATGADLHDEVWEGEYHIAPAPHFYHGVIDQRLAEILGPLARAAGLFVSGAFNLGEPTDYRVPDRGVHRTGRDVVWLPTAVVVVEIVSPDDESWAKLPFYAAHGVDEVLIVDPQQRTVAWLGRVGTCYQPIERSVLGLSAAELTAQLEWPDAPPISP
jgi:Uma2 family endonuclease